MLGYAIAALGAIVAFLGLVAGPPLLLSQVGRSLFDVWPMIGVGLMVATLGLILARLTDIADNLRRNAVRIEPLPGGGVVVGTEGPVDFDNKPEAFMEMPPNIKPAGKMESATPFATAESRR